MWEPVKQQQQQYIGWMQRWSDSNSSSGDGDSGNATDDHQRARTHICCTIRTNEHIQHLTKLLAATVVNARRMDVNMVHATVGTAIIDLYSMCSRMLVVGCVMPGSILYETVVVRTAASLRIHTHIMLPVRYGNYLRTSCICSAYTRPSDRANINASVIASESCGSRTKRIWVQNRFFCCWSVLFVEEGLHFEGTTMILQN